MLRTTLLQKICESGDFNNYLEIGTFTGDSLFPLKCNKKVAVDPFFKIPFSSKLKWWLKNRVNIRTRYFEITSDSFFRDIAPQIYKENAPDLIFIDGLHTFESSLKDVLNSLCYLNKDGVIVMHDCFPPHNAAATPAKSFEDAQKMNVNGWTEEWCGDVWKTIVYLREQYKDSLDVFVFKMDYGLGIIRKKNNEALETKINKTLFEKINVLNYDYLVKNPASILGLTGKESVAEFLLTIKTH